MRQPEGFKLGGRNIVLRLNKVVYGLKQASRQWKIKLDSQFRRFFVLIGHAHRARPSPTHAGYIQAPLHPQHARALLHGQVRVIQNAHDPSTRLSKA